MRIFDKINQFLKENIKLEGVKYRIEENRIIISNPCDKMIYDFEFEKQLNEISPFEYIEIIKHKGKLYRIYHSDVQSIQDKYNLKSL